MVASQIKSTAAVPTTIRVILELQKLEPEAVFSLKDIASSFDI
jgi:hypothetical protein